MQKINAIDKYLIDAITEDVVEEINLKMRIDRIKETITDIRDDLNFFFL